MKPFASRDSGRCVAVDTTAREAVRPRGGVRAEDWNSTVKSLRSPVVSRPQHKRNRTWVTLVDCLWSNLVLNRTLGNARLRTSYANPPVTEAVIEFRFKPKPGFSVEDIDRCTEQVFGTNLGRQILRDVESQIFVADSKYETQATNIGFKLQCESSNTVLQLRLDRLVYSKLAPYTTWEEFSSDALKYWIGYRDVAEPESMQRLGIRYINRFKPETTALDPAEFLTMRIAWNEKELGEQFSAWEVRLGLPFQQQHCTAMLYNSVGREGILLDIDVYRTASLPRPTEPLEPVLSELKEIERRVFESCITDAARELFK